MGLDEGFEEDVELLDVPCLEPVQRQAECWPLAVECTQMVPELEVQPVVDEDRQAVSPHASEAAAVVVEVVVPAVEKAARTVKQLDVELAEAEDGYAAPADTALVEKVLAYMAAGV